MEMREMERKTRENRERLIQKSQELLKLSVDEGGGAFVLILF